MSEYNNNRPDRNVNNVQNRSRNNAQNGNRNNVQNRSRNNVQNRSRNNTQNRNQNNAQNRNQNNVQNRSQNSVQNRSQNSVQNRNRNNGQYRDRYNDARPDREERRRIRQKKKMQKLMFKAAVIAVLIIFLLIFIITSIMDSKKKSKNSDTTKIASAGEVSGSFDDEATNTSASTKMEKPTLAENYQELTDYNYYQSKKIIVMDADNNTILGGRGQDERVYPASTTKVMTLIVAVENLASLDDTFTMTIDITDPLYQQDASVAGFMPDEVITARDMLYGLILLPEPMLRIRIVSDDCRFGRRYGRAYE